ncbi:MAG: response regulator [Candidatus Sumerlaeaceae bacterium]
MPPGNSRHILVVEDDVDVVEVVRLVLGTKGYQITTATNGDEGLAALEQFRPDLIITDLRMPGMSGMEFIKQVRAKPEIADLPILVISSLGAQVDKPDEFWSVGLGSDDFLAKPFDPLGLLGRVEYLLRKNQYISERGHVTKVGPAQSAEAPESQAVFADEPTEVVRRFVSAWNTQDFAAEYNCLGDEMIAGVSRQDYIQRRAQLVADDAGNTHHHVIDAETIKTSNNVATVACLRDDKVGGTSRRKDERYTLRKAADGWKIVNVRSRAMNYSIED